MLSWWAERTEVGGTERFEADDTERFEVGAIERFEVGDIERWNWSLNVMKLATVLISALIIE